MDCEKKKNVKGGEWNKKYVVCLVSIWYVLLGLIFDLLIVYNDI